MSDEAVDIFASAGLKKPDISILSDEFLSEIRGMPQHNVAVELIQKLLKGEIKTRAKRNVIWRALSPSCSIRLCGSTTPRSRQPMSSRSSGSSAKNAERLGFWGDLGD